MVPDSSLSNVLNVSAHVTWHHQFITSVEIFYVCVYRCWYLWRLAVFYTVFVWTVGFGGLTKHGLQTNQTADKVVKVDGKIGFTVTSHQDLMKRVVQTEACGRGTDFNTCLSAIRLICTTSFSPAFSTASLISVELIVPELSTSFSR